MGEKISTLGRFVKGDTEYEVELNHGVRANQPRLIHIQSETMRIELTEHEFVQCISAFRLAAEKLRWMKKKK